MNTFKQADASDSQLSGRQVFALSIMLVRQPQLLNKLIDDRPFVRPTASRVTWKERLKNVGPTRNQTV